MEEEQGGIWQCTSSFVIMASVGHELLPLNLFINIHKLVLAKVTMNIFS